MKDNPNFHKKMNQHFDPCQYDPTIRRKLGHVALETERRRPLDLKHERQCPEPVDWKQERVRKTVDNLLKNITPSRCCMQCPDQDITVPCDTFKFLLKFVQDGGPLCQQSDRDYEQKIVDEIKRRMRLGLCGNVPLAVPPALDYVKVPKKRTKEKKVVKKEKVKKPKPVKPKPVKKLPKPKPKPKPKPGPRIIFLTPDNFIMDNTPPPPGTIQYRLSNRDYIQKGWTKIPPLPENKYKTFYTFLTDPCGPLLETNIWKDEQSYRFYPDGKKMATIEQDGTIKVFYPNCENDLAIHLTPYAENDYRIVVYFNKEEYLNDRHNHLKRKDLPAALFDSFGNGVVYNTKGQIRLNYDQAQGKFVDIPSNKACVCPNTIHPPLHWKWQDYEEIISSRKMLHHESYGCPNMEKTSPNMTLYLPKQRTQHETEHPKSKIDHIPKQRTQHETEHPKSKIDHRPKQRTQHETEHPKPNIDHSPEGHYDLKSFLPQRIALPGNSKKSINTINSTYASDQTIKHSRIGAHTKSHMSRMAQAAKNQSLIQSISDEKSSLRSGSPTSQKSPKMSKRWGKRRHREDQESQMFEMCASELNLQDTQDTALFVRSKQQDKRQTPIRIVLRIENGITLVIMNQCHIHLEFKAFRQHLKFNLGVRVLFTEDPKFTDTLLSESQPRSMTPPPDMFRVYEPRSPSLQALLRAQNLLLGKDKSSISKPTLSSLTCGRRTPKITENNECILVKAPRKPILIRNQCGLEKGVTRPVLPLKFYY